ncbi:MAG TPA: hypothetical protein VFQ80_02315, partial [Thermomicrobiales bacterium]|nr:hypothetical protein [Thermomicrobiales bacterium]
MEPAVATIFVVSDFHMTTGHDPRTGAAGHHESFLHDAAFARFLADAQNRAAAAGGSCRLLLLGDLFDFLRVGDAAGAMPERPANSEDVALAKLERMAAGHGQTLAALGAFAAAGGSIDIVAGNHDIELTRPSAQAQLRELIVGNDADAARSIRVHPWIFYVPGVLYAEHGQQYHDLNSFATLLSSAHGDDRRIDPPLGSYLETYRLRLRQTLDQIAADGTAPRAALRALRRHPAVVPRLSRLHVRFADTLVRDLARRRSRREATRRDRYRRQALPAGAAEIGLPPAILAEIDRLAEAAARGLVGRIGRVALRAKAPGRPLRAAANPTPYLARAALAIHCLLQAEGADVPYYVFGHT